MDETTNLVNEASILVIRVLATALALIVTYYVPKLIGAMERRLKIDVPDPLEAEAERWGLKAIAYGEEYGRRKAKELSAKVPSGEKREAAARWFAEHASPKVQEYVGGKVEGWLESLLGIERSKGPTPSWVTEGTSGDGE